MRKLPLTAGHGEGVKAVRRILNAAPDVGIKILTLYAFSTENWKRPKEEISALLGFLEHYLDTEYKNLMDKGVRFNAIGKIDKFPAALRRKINKVRELTRHNSRIALNLALNYGGRDEILEATRRIAADAKKHKIKPENISEKTFSGYLYTKGMPDPELLIRTGGEMRLSNFLLWQTSYSEIYITKKLWPDFGKTDLRKALDAYKNRKRRLGE
ncbi:MAG: polyprenyl diphosphate synthase [Candidatus Omnitrophota bacterium]